MYGLLNTEGMIQMSVPEEHNTVNSLNTPKNRRTLNPATYTQTGQQMQCCSTINPGPWRHQIPSINQVNSCSMPPAQRTVSHRGSVQHTINRSDPFDYSHSNTEVSFLPQPFDTDYHREAISTGKMQSKYLEGVQ